ncbi:hypothetical protein [Halomonas sp. 11-S5]|uniref:hypothetical protein n=1 Tax=Halomonas sp. 11-S5 TaxID=2994064 RepID=UPI0024688EE5|nr:hypothetical protein [Halomonas sp. 11-S5]
MRKLRRWWRRSVAPRALPAFVPPEMPVGRWLAALRADGVQLAVMCDIEGIADASADRLVLLVADENMPAVRAATTTRGKLPCDLYSLSGISGSQYHDLAYLPVPCGCWLLEQARSDSRGRLPPEALLRVEAFHQAYHLGIEPTGERRVLLERLSEACCEGPQSPLTLERLDAWLADLGWRPPYDTLEKLAPMSPWVAEWLAREALPLDDARRGLAVFLVRECGLGALEMVRRRLFDDGFELLTEGVVDARVHPQAIRDIRGGNWSRGPWPVSGGPPAYYLVVHDVMPQAVDEGLQVKHPGLDNARLLKTKLAVRDRYNRDRPRAEQCNILHSSDNARQALAYLEVLAPECIEEVVECAEALQKEFHCPYPVLADLSGNARRAKVELIDFHGQPAICKTFRRGRERFLAREVEARHLASDLEEVSRLLEVGPNHLVFERYENAMAEISAWRPMLHRYPVLPLWVVQRLQEVIRHYRRLGYECVDLKPGNLLFDPDKGLKVIDFEFLQEGGRCTDQLRGNLAWFAPQEDFRGDLPVLRQPRDLYYRRWFRHTALPLFFCLHAFPRPVLVVVRVATLGYFSVLNVCRAVLQGRGSHSPRHQP